jgi:hypothetical protein
MDLSHSRALAQELRGLIRAYAAGELRCKRQRCSPDPELAPALSLDPDALNQSFLQFQQDLTKEKQITLAIQRRCFAKWSSASLNFQSEVNSNANEQSNTADWSRGSAGLKA